MFEINIEKSWCDAVYARSSVRKFTGAPDEAQLSRLGEMCRKLSWQGVTIRMFRGPGLRRAGVLIFGLRVCIFACSVTMETSFV